MKPTRNDETMQQKEDETIKLIVKYKHDEKLLKVLIHSLLEMYKDSLPTALPDFIKLAMLTARGAILAKKIKLAIIKDGEDHG